MMMAAFLALLVSMLLVLLRAILGPTVHDRVLAANAFGSNTVVLVSAFAMAVDNPLFLDIALTYALINFITTIALLKYFQYGRLDVDQNMPIHPEPPPPAMSPKAAAKPSAKAPARKQPKGRTA
jgi:multicomponent Na+:H+ antiporter subunit F